MLLFTGKITMPARFFTLLIAIATLLLSGTFSASANMRAAHYLILPPSFSLTQPPAVADLMVLAETLDIECGYAECRVRATYTISSNVQVSLPLIFIMPSEVPVRANVAGDDVPVVVSFDETQMWSPPEQSWMYSSTFPLYQAAFTGTVYPGENSIRVDYVQPLSLLERDYGYFTHSRYVEKFSYVMAPLKEWRLADDFTMTVTVSTPRKRTKRDGWSLFKSRKIDCGTPSQRVTKSSERLTLRIKYTQDFPDTFVCWAGDSDLLKND